MRAVAILTAAGGGVRLACGVPKALVELAGVPLVVRSARALADAGMTRIVVTAAPGSEALVEQALRAAALSVPVEVVVGGPSRQASVAAGLVRVATDPDGMPADPRTVVLVHDAARPLVPVAVVRRVVDAVLAGHAAVVPGLPVTDTVKQVATHPDGGALRVTATMDRRSLRTVQTPQGFTLEVLRSAHDAGAHRAVDDDAAATDDAALVEALGVDVWVVEGHEDAMKITTQRDLAVAELLVGAP